MIGLVIPAYNAGPTVAEAVRGGAKHLPRVVVVDDGSADDTAARAAQAGAEVIRHPANRGKGAALRTGFDRMARDGAEAVVTMDADLQHEPDQIPRLVEAWQAMQADLVIGSRQDHFEAMSRGRRAGNRFSCGALRFFTGLEIPDSQSGFRLYGDRFLRDLTLRRDGYDAEVEVLLQAARDRRRIACVPIRMSRPDGAAFSSFRPWVDTYRICRTVVHFSVCELWKVRRTG
ncbi:MAG: glycosyltransferase family 2 protein [Candidatus Polarisedimenticolia bacterium]